MSRKERRAAAARARQGGRGIPSEVAWAEAMFAQAVRHHQAGEYLEADRHCRAVLSRDPSHAGCLHLLGTIALQTHRFEEAASYFSTLVQARPELAFAHHGLGNALAALGRLEEATAALERALAARPADPTTPVPDEAMTALNLGYLQERLGRPERAIAFYERAIAAKPNFAEAYNNLGVLLLAQGKPRDASAVFTRALLLAPELFASFPDVKAMLLRINPDLGDAIARAEAAWPERLPAADILGPESVAITADPLLRCVLESTAVCDIGLERLLISARAAVLDRAVDGGAGIDDDLLGFACSLARQCFINDYVYVDTTAELEQVERLTERLSAALREGAAVPALWLAAVASYRPLHAVPESQLLQQRTWPEPADKLITQQIDEVHDEERLRETIPQLTPISGEASDRVRGQYEENPYPRWVLAPAAHVPVTINEFLQREFPGVPFRPLDDRDGLDILVAGCGTGHHPIGIARRFARARVLAVDLSLASLNYALRKTRELGVGNIEYGQADIAGLAGLGRTFSMVDASGVLHHLADPMQGWQQLYDLTRPGGIMRIGLYSELGRAEVAAARRFIAERGFQPTAADIRRCREELLQTPMRRIANSNDFYSISECRDLLFHVEEHRLSIPQIKAFLDAHQLRFIGFELAPAVREGYRARFPGDPTMTDLGSWHAFETENPTTFAGMYQFYCLKS